MATYRITTRSTVYEVHEVEAESVEQAAEMVGEDTLLSAWSEDTEVYDVEVEEDEE